jgi:diadenosine tetraphosphate (Ap4A) HIT family hydrolase
MIEVVEVEIETEATVEEAVAETETETEPEAETDIKYDIISLKEIIMIIWENNHFYIEKEPHKLPWVKLFSKEPFKELTDMPKELRDEMWDIYYIVEEEMMSHFNPDKINMASFANMLPRVHIHIMARFKDDDYFPNPLWGEKLRDSELNLEDFQKFYDNLFERLTKSM